MKTRIYTLSDRLPFGKYKGQTLQSVIEQAPDYAAWCRSNVAGFKLGEDAEALLSSRMSAGVGSTHNGGADVAGKPEPDAPASSARSGKLFGPEILGYSERLLASYRKNVMALAEDAEIISDYSQARKAINLLTEDFAAASARGIQLEIPF